MSGLLSGVADFVGLGPELEKLRAILGLRGLKPASFRGIPFHAEDTEAGTGRRVVVHEFPLSDDAQTEDLGRKSREISITGYVIGPSFADDRDLLLAALEDNAKPGTLVLPGGQEFAARCTSVRTTQSAEGLNLIRFAMTFVEAGEVSSAILAKPDTAAQLRASIGRVMRLARAAFGLVYAVRNAGDLVRAIALEELTRLGDQLGGVWLGLPGLNLFGTAEATKALQEAPQVDAPLDQVLAPSRALADAALELPRNRATPAGLEATDSRAAPPPSRQMVAMALLAVANAPAPAPVVPQGVVPGRIEANRRALDALSRAGATLMAAEVLSLTDFPNADAALRARDALLAAMDARADAAAEAGQDDLWRGWRELAAIAARDLAERARRAPLLAEYAVPATLPSLALAQRLQQSGAGADALVALNDAPHPAFMPATGQVVRA
jgi:prophage DNA circulation protein